MSTVSIWAPSARAPQPLRGRVVVGELHRVDGERERELVGEPGAAAPSGCSVSSSSGRRCPYRPSYSWRARYAGLAERRDRRLELGPARRRSASSMRRRHAGATSHSYARSTRCTVEAERAVQPERGLVVGRAEQHAGIDARARARPASPAIASARPSPVPWRAGIDADDVDLAEPRDRGRGPRGSSAS